MKYFTGEYQGNIPILSNDQEAAELIDDAGAALHIARLMTAIYGVHWIAMPIDKAEGVTTSNFIIERA